MKLTDLSNEELLSQLDSIVCAGRRLRARLIAYLIEVEERRLHLDSACSSLFDFCVRRLGMSEGEAFRRITAARLAKRIPGLLGRIERGEIHLSALVLLRDHLDERNHAELLDAAKGKSKREVQEIIAARFPKADAPSMIRRLPSPAAVASSVVSSSGASHAESCGQPLLFVGALSTGSSPSPASNGQGQPAMSVRAAALAPTRDDSRATDGAGADDAHRIAVSSRDGTDGGATQRIAVTSGDGTGKGDAHGAAAASRNVSGADATPASNGGATRGVPAQRVVEASRRALIEPLSAGRYKVQLTVGSELREKIERATALMRHRNPKGDLAVIMERAVDLLIAELEKERLGKTRRPPKEAAGDAHDGRAMPARATRPGYVSRAVRRQVFERDGEQCTFVDEKGRRCPAREYLELDHIVPRALGGTDDADNLRVACRMHNHRAAERAFGRAYVEQRIRTRQRKQPAPAGVDVASSHRAPDASHRSPEAEHRLSDAEHRSFDAEQPGRAVGTGGRALESRTCADEERASHDRRGVADGSPSERSTGTRVREAPPVSPGGATEGEGPDGTPPRPPRSGA